ncbi:TPA: hypothetical protein ACGOW9_000382 [Streptococcus suis]
MAEDSRILEINIYEFLNLFANFHEQNIEFNFDAFQEFYYNFNHDIVLLEEKIGKKMSEIKASDRDSHFDEFKTIYDKYFDNIYFKFICLKTESLDFQVRTPLDKMRIIFNNKLVRSTLTAYKLFYVGCSRAEEELVVLIDKNKIGDVERVKNCFKHLGFNYD